MEKITEKEVGVGFVRVYLNKLSKHQYGNEKYLPTHYTMTPGENGFDKVKYYRLDLAT